jgi:hypothetical protein
MTTTYRQFISVAPRFARSVNVERDIRSRSAIDGYVVTSTAQNVLLRLLHGLAKPGAHRAWTLTGAYGSGKSAFAVFLASILGDSRDPSAKSARELLRTHAPTLAKDFFDRRSKHAISANGYCPIVLTAAAEPLTVTLLRAANRDVRRYCSHGRPPKLLKQLESMIAGTQRGKLPSSAETVDVLTQLAHSLARSGRSHGIVIVIDELGKFLEYAARTPESGDIFTLQLLAEASGQHAKPDLLVFTILHQAFDRYVAGLRPSVRDEWSKVQGRFEDVAFQESPEEFLLLVSKAIRQTPCELTEKLRQRAGKLADQAYSLGLSSKSLSRTAFRRIMQDCAPLHPLTVLTLARLCRKFGQNQRSLFSFLVSQEQHGFAAYLEGTVTGSDLQFYPSSNLYDFTAGIAGSGLSIGESASRWAEVQSALDRDLNATAEELRVIKVVGLLAALGAYGALKPSASIIQFAEPVSGKRAIKQLLDRSLLVYRKHSDSYGLWEGSDVDLDAAVREASSTLTEFGSLADKLRAIWTPRAIVAKRHSITTGTLRFFVPRFAGATDLTEIIADRGDADGVLLLALPNSAAEREQLIELVKSAPIFRERPEVVVAVPKYVDAVKEALREVELLNVVKKSTAALQGDAVARRELNARLAAAEVHLQRELAELFTPNQSDRTGWFHKGLPIKPQNPRSFSELLSGICDQVYEAAPPIQNELVNRNSLSSAAAAARRNLIEAMITKSGEARLGIQGTPPEMSMYVSLLQDTGIHRQEKRGLGFGAPTKSVMQPAWQAIVRFFDSCELSRRPVVELFSKLQHPPFGMKKGAIPVFFCAAALAHDTEIGLYEAGGFVPDLNVELFERLLSSPERFEIRRYSIAGVRRQVFNQFANLLEATGGAAAPKETLVEIVRPLFRFFNRLHPYNRQTKSLSATAIAVREALFAAREPDQLLFTDLPKACGFDPFLPNTRGSKNVDLFFRTLQKALLELQRAYDDLLASLQQMLFRAFGISSGKAREVIRSRALGAAEHAVESRLRAFLLHLTDNEQDDVVWIEAIASLLAGKPARMWTDMDRARYEITLSELTRNFRHIESLVLELGKRLPAHIGDVVRIGVTDRFSKDRERVIVVEPHNQDAVAEGVIKIEEAIERQALSGSPELALAALAIAAGHYLAEVDERGITKQTAKEQATHG